MSATENVHSPACASEAAAADKAAAQEESIRARILGALEFNTLTPEGFAAQTGLLLNTVRRRFTDLWKDGLIKWNGDYRANRRGNPSKVWTRGDDPERHKAPRRATAKRVAELEEENERLRKRVDYLEARCLLLEKGKQRELFG